MTREELNSFLSNTLPIIKETAADDDSDGSPDDRNPLRPMLRMLLRYIDYLEGRIVDR